MRFQEGLGIIEQVIDKGAVYKDCSKIYGTTFLNRNINHLERSRIPINGVDHHEHVVWDANLIEWLIEFIQ